MLKEHTRFKYLHAITLGVFLGVGMMMTPLTKESGMISLVVMAVMFVVICRYCGRRYGIASLKGLIILLFLGVAVEYIGIKTCFPYGCFQYSDLVGPRFFGTFPYSLLFIWPVIVVSIIQFTIKHELLQLEERPLRKEKQALLGGVMLTLFDVVLDPVAVAMGLWSYQPAGLRYGVPMTNYLGWILTGTISCYVILTFSEKLVGDRVLKLLGIALWAMYLTAFLFVV